MFMFKISIQLKTVCIYRKWSVFCKPSIKLYQGWKMKAMEKPETIIFLWFVAFAILLFIITLKFQNYSVDVRTTTSALLTTPFAIWALITS